MVNLPFEISFITRVRDLTEDEQKVVAEFAEKIVKSRPNELTLEKVQAYDDVMKQFVAWAESRQFVFPSSVYPRKYTEREHECVMHKLVRGECYSPGGITQEIIKVVTSDAPDYIKELERKLAIEDIERYAQRMIEEHEKKNLKG